MKRNHWILLVALAILVFTTVGLFLMRPRRVDMAAYAPANSLLYMETDDPLAIVNALMTTDAWRMVRGTDAGGSYSSKGWLSGFMKFTGIGPVQSVALSRAQVAIVVTDLGTTEDGETLRVKPEFALIIETKTSEFRIRSSVESALQQLAQSTYDKPVARRTLTNDVEFIEWRSQDGSRQIVAAIVGSLVVVGNSEASVQRCLNSAAGRSPSLKDDVDLQLLRRELAGDQALTFGYVPEAKSAQLLSFVVPLLLGRAPGDASFQKLVSTASAKLFRSIAWSSKSISNGIEDRYLIALQPPVLRQLQPSFRLNGSNSPKRIPPENTYSVTYYRLENPLMTWEGLRTSVAANTDALSAVVFSSLLKSALVSYGLNEPDAFLKTVTGDIATFRLDPNGDQTLLIARISNRDELRKLITTNMKLEANQQQSNREFFVSSEGETAAALVGDFVIMGDLAGVRRYSETFEQSGDAQQEDYSRRLSTFYPLQSSSPIVTYTDDRDRVRRFFEALRTADTPSASAPANMEVALGKLPYAATQTKLSDEGFERITRSPLGQFSSLLPLLIPEPRGAQKPLAPSR
ncbi:MAG TPA: hypothetical protein VJU86_04760 [Pyrinomonadaceae bacterium]|nr:hypothetical protein [Pyrinomonadaceae bacterium]